MLGNKTVKCDSCLNKMEVQQAQVVHHKPNVLLQFPLLMLGEWESCWQEACALSSNYSKNIKISVPFLVLTVILQYLVCLTFIAPLEWVDLCTHEYWPQFHHVCKYFPNSRPYEQFPNSDCDSFHFLFRSVVAVYTGTLHGSSVICYYGCLEAFGRAPDTNK